MIALHCHKEKKWLQTGKVLTLSGRMKSFSMFPSLCCLYIIILIDFCQYIFEKILKYFLKYIQLRKMREIREKLITAFTFLF